jgi:hypothetical protein
MPTYRPDTRDEPSQPIAPPPQPRKTVMVPMSQNEDQWVDLGPGPMVITAVKGDCVFGTGDVAPEYSEVGGLPIPAQAPLFINTTLHVWGRRAPDIGEAEIVVGPL